MKRAVQLTRSLARFVSRTCRLLDFDESPPPPQQPPRPSAHPAPPIYSTGAERHGARGGPARWPAGWTGVGPVNGRLSMYGR